MFGLSKLGTRAAVRQDWNKHWEAGLPLSPLHCGFGKQPCSCGLRVREELAGALTAASAANSLGIWSPKTWDGGDGQEELSSLLPSGPARHSLHIVTPWSRQVGETAPDLFQTNSSALPAPFLLLLGLWAGFLCSVCLRFLRHEEKNTQPIKPGLSQHLLSINIIASSLCNGTSLIHRFLKGTLTMLASF